MANSATRFLRAAPPGTRVVIRRRVVGGFTDALGYLRSCAEQSCAIQTRRGMITVLLADVVAAHEVPEPPVRRSGGGRSSPDS